MKGKLILEDGSVFHGELLNNIKATGEVVFNTGMVGYQDDFYLQSSRAGVLTSLTLPHIKDFEWDLKKTNSATGRWRNF